MYKKNKEKQLNLKMFQPFGIMNIKHMFRLEVCLIQKATALLCRQTRHSGVNFTNIL